LCLQFFPIKIPTSRKGREKWGTRFARRQAADNVESVNGVSVPRRPSHMFGLPRLLGESYLSYQICVSRIGVQGGQGKVGAQRGDPEVAFLIGRVEPFEGVILVTEFCV
jgi:hypothetical protein